MSGPRPQHLAGDLRYVTVEQRRAERVFFEQRQDFRNQLAVARGGRSQKFPAFGLRMVQCFVEQLLNLLPARTVHRALPAGEHYPPCRSSCASHARAARQSRRTVASETASSSAASFTSRPPKKRLSTIRA